MSKKVWCIAIIFLIILSSTLSLAKPEDQRFPRAWHSELTILEIRLNNTTTEPTIYNEYRKQTHEVLITVQNTGSITLTNLNLSYSVKRGIVTELQGMNKSKKKLMISEEFTYSFFWTPSKGNGEIYTINISATSKNFGSLMEPVFEEETITIRNVKFDVGPINYELDSKPASPWNEYANQTQIVNALVNNYGNFELSTPFNVSAAIYSFPTFQELWSDSKTCSQTISPNQMCKIKFDKPWTPLNPNIFIINISTDLLDDDKPDNDNITSQLGIMDIVDAGIFKISNLEDGGVYPVIPFSVNARIKNTGNLNFTTNFSVELKIKSYPSGLTIFNPTPQQIPGAGPGSIEEPGTITNIVFPPWIYAENLTDGRFSVNLSINPFEINGSAVNNEFSIIIELKNFTEIHVECEKPKAGLHYRDDLKDVTVKITNSGTIDLKPYILNLTVKNLYKPGEAWQDLAVTPEQSPLPWNNWALVEVLDEWPLGFNTKFSLNITLKLSSELGVPVAWCTRTIEIDGSEKNGTISGYVFDLDEQRYLENIKINIYSTGYVIELVNFTTTNIHGYYSIILPGSPEGTKYSVTTTEEDNYWWYEKSFNRKSFSGRNTMLNITLASRPVGRLEGVVNLIAPDGVPEVKEDWTGTNLSVEDTPISFSTDNLGNFEAEVVADVVNITATKDNFKTARLEYITILPNTTESVELDLIESWSVKVAPKNGAVDLDPYLMVNAEFDKAIDKTTIKPSTFDLLDTNDNRVSGLSVNSYNFSKNSKICRMKLPVRLYYNSTYKIKLTKKILTTEGSPALHRTWESEFSTALGLGIMMGRCTDFWTDSPIVSVNINITDLPGFSTYSDNKGVYFLENIPIGEHWVNVSLKGYPPQILKIIVKPEIITWANFTFEKGVPIPNLWGEDEFGRLTLINEELTHRIKIDVKFNLTSSFSLDPTTVNSNTIKIIEKSKTEPIEFKNVTSSNNNLKFLLVPEKDLKYNTLYQIYFGPDLRKFGGPGLFLKDYYYGEFETESRHSLDGPSFFPRDKSVNIPIDTKIFIEFPVSMNQTSVEKSINASFNIIDYIWSDFNMTLKLKYDELEHFTEYTISLLPGMISESGGYSLFGYVNISFTTILGFIEYVFGPIIDNSGQPVVNASLVILDSEEVRVSSSFTNESGYAKFLFRSKLETGNYTIKIIKNNYKTETWELVIDSDGEPVLISEPPVLVKKKDKSEDEFSIALVVLIVVLIIIMILMLYLIKLKIKPKDKDVAIEKIENAPEQLENVEPIGVDVKDEKNAKLEIEDKKLEE